MGNLQIGGWEYYNHAAVPTCGPHENPDLTPIKDGSIWQIRGGVPLLARWTSDWDCGHETSFWYVIKDTPFDIDALKSKRRYEINKGNRNFYVRKIVASNHVEDLFTITVDAFKGWPEKYRPTVDEEMFRDSIDTWNKLDVFGVFSKENDELCGYAQLRDKISYIEFSVLRTKPETERLGVNAAMVNGILEYYKNRFDGMFYINDGSRAIRHETLFQDYLEKYFNFRKAYCRLNLEYRNGIGFAVRTLYPFRKILKTESGLGSQMAGILKMEEIRRKF